MSQHANPNRDAAQIDPEDLQRAEKIPETDIEYVDSSAQLWAVVIKEGEKYDETLVEKWKGDMDGILIFTGLFSATVSAFIIDGYKYLSRNSNDTTVQLLTQITQQLSASATGSVPPPPFTLPPFNYPSSMLKVNILWFLSLGLSVSCALAATLIQQWARNYLLTTRLPSSPQRRARVRAYLFQGLHKFRLDSIVNTVPILLHASVFLFFTGLVEFLFQITNTVAYIFLSFVIVCAIVYIGLTLLPLFYRDCPYRTPMSGPLWRFLQAIQVAFFALCRRVYKVIVPNWTPRLLNLKGYVGKCKERLLGGLQHDLERRAISASQDLDTSALRWTLQSLRGPSELESFIAGIPGFLGSITITSEQPQLTPPSITLYNLLHLNDVHLGLRIGHLLKTQVHTPIASLDTLWHITRWYNAVNLGQWDNAFGEATVDALHALKGSRDSTIALTARCSAALGVRVVLKDLGRVHSQSPVKTLRVMELHKTLQTLLLMMDTQESIQEELLTDEDFIRDGHLLNLAHVLIGVIPLLSDVDETRAKVLWDTLETLRIGLDLSATSQKARSTITHAWEVYERELIIWSSSQTRRQQLPGSMDRYKSKMQALVAPTVLEIQAL